MTQFAIRHLLSAVQPAVDTETKAAAAMDAVPETHVDFAARRK